MVALGTATHGHFLKIPSKPMEYVTYTAIYVTWLGIFKKEITKIVFLAIFGHFFIGSYPMVNTQNCLVDTPVNVAIIASFSILFWSLPKW